MLNCRLGRPVTPYIPTVLKKAAYVHDLVVYVTFVVEWLTPVDGPKPTIQCLEVDVIIQKSEESSWLTPKNQVCIRHM